MPKVRLRSGERQPLPCQVSGIRSEPCCSLPQCKLFTESDLLTYVRTLRKLYEPN